MPGGFTNILKEYGIVLGFKANEDQYKQAMSILAKLEKGTNQVAGKIGMNFAKGSVIVLSAIGSIMAGTNAFMKSVAEADLQTEKFANRMWMTERNARGLQESLKALKMDMGDINDIAIHPELRERFFKLRADAAKYESSDVDVGLKKIREFQFEFTRTQILMSYAGRYIAYYLQMYLEKPMEQIRLKLKAFNDKGPESVQKWAKRIARFAAIVVRLGTTAIRFIGDIITAIDKLPPKAKAAALIIAGIGLIMAAPWLAVSAAILGVLLLLDDFYTWKRGGKSAFGKIWEELEELKESLTSDDGATVFLSNVNTSAGELLVTLQNIADVLGIIGHESIPVLQDGWDMLLDSVGGGLKDTIHFLNYLSDLIDKVARGEISPWEAIKQIGKDWKAQGDKKAEAIKQNMARQEAEKEGRPMVPMLNVSEGEEAERITTLNLLEKISGLTGKIERILPLMIPEKSVQVPFPGIQPIALPVMANGPQNQVYNTTTSTRNQKTYQVQQDNRVTQNMTFNVNGSNARSDARTISTYLRTAQNRAESSWANGRLSGLDKLDKN